MVTKLTHSEKTLGPILERFWLFWKRPHHQGAEYLEHTSNTRDSVSWGYPNTVKRIENTTRSGVFLTKLDMIYLLNRNKNQGVNEEKSSKSMLIKTGYQNLSEDI